MVAAPASADWSSSGSGAATGATGTLAPPTGVTVPASSASTVPVTWTASAASPVPTGYYLIRVAAGSAVSACGTSPSELVRGTSCSDSAVPPGTYTYRAIAVYRSWTAASTASSNVAVATASKVVFTSAPTNAVAGTAIKPSIGVTVETATGIPVPKAATAVTLAIGSNPGCGTLSGTLTAVTNSNGEATFGDISINKAGVGCTLMASSSGIRQLVAPRQRAASAPGLPCSLLR